MMAKQSEASVKKKKSTRKKEESISDKLRKISKMSKEDCILLLSSIAQGKEKDFTGLPPSIDSRIKAVEKLLPLIDEEQRQSELQSGGVYDATNTFLVQVKRVPLSPSDLGENETNENED